MGIEFTIVKEMAVISATLCELAAVNRIICEEIGSPDFHREYRDLLGDITNSYLVVDTALSPLTALRTLAEFRDRFDSVHRHYSDTYQAALSEPRINAEFTYEKYLQFRKRRELATSYPVLKRTFSRLHDFIDKWIDNDIWLAMCIDTQLKMLNRLLNEVAEQKSRDEETAFHLYHSAVGNLPPYLQIIDNGLKDIMAQALQYPIAAQTAH